MTLPHKATLFPFKKCWVAQLSILKEESIHQGLEFFFEKFYPSTKNIF